MRILKKSPRLGLGDFLYNKYFYTNNRKYIGVNIKERGGNLNALNYKGAGKANDCCCS